MCDMCFNKILFDTIVLRIIFEMYEAFLVVRMYAIKKLWDYKEKQNKKEKNSSKKIFLYQARD